MKSAAIHISILIFLLACSNSTFSQRISSGLNVNVPFAGMVHFKQNYYSPVNNFRVYFVNVPDEEKEKFNRFSVLGLGKWYKTIGIGAGYTAKIDYKRFALRIGYQFTFVNSVIKLNQFNDGSQGVIEIYEYPAEFKMQAYHHKFPVTFSFDLKKKNNSPFLLFGAEYGYIFAKTESIDWDFNVFYDRYNIDYMYNHYYSNAPYLYAAAGIGIKKKRFEWMFSFKKRIDKAGQNLTMASQFLDFNMNYYLAYKSFKRKHYLFIDE
jgi:hypothetical protein